MVQTPEQQITNHQIDVDNPGELSLDYDEVLRVEQLGVGDDVEDELRHALSLFTRRPRFELRVADPAEVDVGDDEP